MQKSKMKLFPFDEVARDAMNHVNQGHTIHQQFNCQHCGVKQTMGTPNKFYMHGICEECDSVTDIHKDGCNYVLMVGLRTGRQ